MGLESRRLKVNGLYAVFTVFETLGILGRDSRCFLAKTFCFFSAIFLNLDRAFSIDNGVLFIGKTLWVFKMLNGANIMH